MIHIIWQVTIRTGLGPDLREIYAGKFCGVILTKWAHEMHVNMSVVLLGYHTMLACSSWRPIAIVCPCVSWAQPWAVQ